MASPHRRLTLLLVAIAASGCAAPARTPGPRLEATAPASPRDALAEPWLVQPASGAWTHRIQLDAVLLSRVDSVERSDTLRALVGATWSRVAGTTPARLSGLITEYQLANGAQTEPATPSGLLLPVPFSAELGVQEGQPRFVQPSPEGCGAAAAAAQTLREIVLAVPETLTTGMTWRDSSSYVICRDSLPLAARSERSFLVLGAARRGADVVVLVERRSVITVSASGTQFGEPLSIEAHGTGTALLEISLAGGVLIAGAGETELTMMMRGRRRSQELQQRTRISITSPED